MRTIHETSALFRSRALSPVELTRTCLDLIEELNPQLNAFVTVTASALAEAEAAEEAIQRGEWLGPMHGIPIGLKDIIDTAGVRPPQRAICFVTAFRRKMLTLLSG